MIGPIVRFNRAAVTLIEVIFSIGVILIGLLGLLSVLPLAGRRAQDAISLSKAAEMGDAVLNELESRKLLNRGLLLDMSSSQGLAYDAGSRTLVRSSGSVDTPVPAFCIDPMYVAENSTSTTNHFDSGFFPYYAENCDPLINPSSSVTAGTNWPFLQPRLRRVGLRVAVPAPTNFLAFNLEQSRSLVENPDDLDLDRPKDRSLSAVIKSLASGTALDYGKRVPTGEFSWIATVSPLRGNRFASVSVVVFRQRDRVADFPSGTETDPKKNATNERIAYVTGFTGFTGGAGGNLRLVASQSVLDTIRSGDWIMLSRRIGSGANQFDVHRWYRVAAVGGDASQLMTDGTSTTQDTDLDINWYLPTATGTSVWSRQVLLDGPDWDFGLVAPVSPNPANFSDDTFATIVSGVVSVTERIIPLTQL